jgi:hypothetical protein
LEPSTPTHMRPAVWGDIHCGGGLWISGIRRRQPRLNVVGAGHIERLPAVEAVDVVG